MVENVTVVHKHPKILAGMPVFKGTQVPARNPFDYPEADDSLDKFLDAFPSVTREQAIAALEVAREGPMTRAVSSR